MRHLLTLVVMNLTVLPALAQEAAAERAAAPASTQPAISPMSARVVQLTGSASYKVTDANGNAGEWKAAKVGDVLSAGTQIRTQNRARVILAFGDDTVVVLERMTLASIDQFHRTADTKHVRLGLGHGAVRAGVSETTLRSDMTIQTPTATLSKKGTMDYRFSYEPSTGHFVVSLNREGLVEALNNVTGQSQLVRPGQWVTQAMQTWINTLTNARWVPVVDTYGLTDAELAFNSIKQSGLSVMDPGAGGNTYSIAGRDLQGIAGGRAGPSLNFAPLVTTPQGGGIFSRPEGNFGTGRGSLSLRRLR